MNTVEEFEDFKGFVKLIADQEIGLSIKTTVAKAFVSSFERLSSSCKSREQGNLRNENEDLAQEVGNLVSLKETMEKEVLELLKENARLKESNATVEFLQKMNSALGHDSETWRQKLVTTLAENRQLQDEIAYIDSRLARIPALENDKTRADKVDHAIREAKMASALQRQVDELYEENKQLNAHLEEHHIPNEETRAAMQEVDSQSFDTLDSLLKDLNKEDQPVTVEDIFKGVDEELNRLQAKGPPNSHNESNVFEVDEDDTPIPGVPTKDR